ncbi:M48 family metalloprotease [Methylocapsa palsarum]|uniref:Putative Zn-dependent protease n=1 Tax=Methylocapsa palsarum TaxID=1612308 RepID=A0A1I3Z982_9HYPH|nr:M48 family metalloprotease [Methylocapsa palsarum]SFK40607.1 Putative Zn-dependent protease [Methylocapsa palsarum]
MTAVVSNLWSRLRSPRERRLSPGSAIAFAAALTLTACASLEPPGNEPMNAAPTPPLPPPRAAGLETKTSAEHRRMVALFNGEYKYPSAEHYLNKILVRLADTGETASDPYRVTILNSPIVNAFALPPDNVYVTRGLLALANDASEVAAVMAHEIAHITARHALRREEEEKRAAVISRAASVIQNKEKSEEVEATARRTIASFSRQQELEADEIGIRAIARAGFDPYGAARFLSALGRSAAMRTSLIGQNASADRPDILATHPSTPERVTQAIAAARQISAPGIGATDRAAYLAAIEGMAFGDDPSEGAIRGRRYVHGRLGFAFTAPEGFVLETSSQAVLGVAGGGAEALRLDTAKAPPTVTLETYLASGWIEGLLASSIETDSVNGAPAAIATAHAGEWSFRVAVIRLEPTEVYRLIFATRTLGAESEKRFRSALDSFHHASAEEIRAVRPLRVGIVTAKAGEDADALAARMAVPDRQLDFFLLINGLESQAALQTGERYKIITE